MSITIFCPLIPMKTNPKLLSIPIPRQDMEYLREISEVLERDIESKRFRKFPHTAQKLKEKLQNFKELYERTKTEEKQMQGKKLTRALSAFYRIGLFDQNDEQIQRRLEHRRRKYIRKHKKNSRF